MAHFARLDRYNTVTSVAVVNNDVLLDGDTESEDRGIVFLTLWSNGHYKWRQTSYNAKFRKNYAGVGFSYDEIRDAFIPPKPYTSWILDESTCRWVAPVAVPADGKQYVWHEPTAAWVEINKE